MEATLEEQAIPGLKPSRRGWKEGLEVQRWAMVYLEQLVCPKTHCLALCVAQVGDTPSPFYYLIFLPISKILSGDHPTGPQKHSGVSTLSHSLDLHLSKWWPYAASSQSFWSLQDGLGPVKEGQDELEPRDRTPERLKWLRLWCGAVQAQHWPCMEWRWPETRTHEDSMHCLLNLCQTQTLP